MVMVVLAISLVEKIMHFWAARPDLAAFLDKPICLRYLKAEGTHIKQGLLCHALDGCKLRCVDHSGSTRLF